MAGRRYLNNSARELEAIFKTQGHDAAIRRALLHELSFRRTDAAVRLRKRIEAAEKTPPAPARPLAQGSLSLGPEPSAPAPKFQPAQTLARPAPVPPASSASEPVRRPKPPLTDTPADILRAWTALEVLSPQGFRRKTDLVSGNPRRIAPLDSDQLPWEWGETSIPGKRLYYEIIFGTMGLSSAVEALLRNFSDTRPDKPSLTNRAVLASVLVDKKGRPLEDEDTVAVSSFAWGVPVALNGDLTKLAEWPRISRDLRRELQRRLIRRDYEGEILVLDRKTIRQGYDFLVGTLGLLRLDVSEPDFALRRYEFFASKVPPEPGILNSFFLDDLERALALFSSGAAPETIRLYLGASKPAKRLNLLEDNDALREVLQPANTPLGRWPARGRHPLVLLQQAAVNGTTTELKDAGILAVNGPPGTGKTTLLRDIVVARIVERAEIMAKFHDPAAGRNHG